MEGFGVALQRRNARDAQTEEAVRGAPRAIILEIK